MTRGKRSYHFFNNLAGWNSINRTMFNAVLIMSIMVFLTGFAKAQPAGYAFFKEVSVNAAQITGTHNDFVVLYSVTDADLRTTSNGGNVENNNGYDIIFTSNDGNSVYDHEIESYDASTGELVAWVKVPVISSASGATLRMYYGNASINTDPSTQNTWSANRYNSVFHFNNAFSDATPAQNNGTNFGTAGVTGQIAGARSFNGTSDYVNVSSDLSQVIGTDGTVSAWIRTTQTGNNTPWQAPGLTGIEESGGGNDIFYGFIGTSGNIGVSAGNGAAVLSGSNINNNQWTHVVFTRNSTTGLVQVYINGVLDNSVFSETGPKTNPFTSIGRLEDTGGTPVYYAGEMDEFRVSDQVLSTDLIATTYQSQSSPGTFLSVGSEQAVSSPPPSQSATPPAEVVATALQGGAIDITFDDVSSTPDITIYNVKRATVSGGPYTQIGTVTDTDASDYTLTDNTATDGTTYFYVVSSVNINSEESTNSNEDAATADATAPMLQSATIQQDELTLDYDELLNSGNTPSVNDFVVLLNGNPVSVINTQLASSRIILTIDPEAVSGDNLQVSYSIGSNPVRDPAGNLALAFSNQTVENQTFSTGSFGPDPCPISNNNAAAWACFSGIFSGTNMTGNVGGLTIANVSAAAGSSTTFSPNALQQWASGAFSGDEFNGPQLNPSGNSGNTTSFDINIPAGVPSDALILSLNRLRPDGGATTYTLEAFDGSNQNITVNDWITGQGTDGGVCTNAVNLNYTNGNTTIEFQPTVSANPSCASSSTPIWFRITDDNVERIEIRKVSSNPDNIHMGMAIVADFGDAPQSFGTQYSGLGNPPAFHLLSNTGSNPVFLGSLVNADGNGSDSPAANGDVDEAIVALPDINAAQSTYSVTLVCTDGAAVSGWIDFDQSGTFDASEFTSAICSGGTADLEWSGISGLVTGDSFARFRTASALSSITNATGAAVDGEVEDYTITIIPPPLPDLEVTKSVDDSSPNEGETVTFTVEVTNPGEFDATGIKITDQLPAGLTIISASASQGTYNASTGIWNIGSIAATGDSVSVSLTISAQVNTGTLGNTIINTASISALNETDPVLSNNTAVAGISVVPEQADIDVSVTSSNNTPIEGEFIDVTISVTNSGPKTANNLSILSQIPSGLSFIDSTTSSGSFNPATGLWNIGTLNPGNSVSLVLEVRVDADTEGSIITFASSLNAMEQVDPVTSNNTGSTDITISIPPTNLSCGSDFPRFVNPSLISGTALQTGAVYRYDSILPGVYAEVEILTINNVTLLNLDAPGSQSGVGSDDEFAPYVNNGNQGSGFIDFEISFFDSTTGLTEFLTFSATTGDVDGTGDLRDYVGYQNLNSFVVENTTNLIPGSQGSFSTFISSDFNNTVPGNADFTDYKVYTSYTNETSFRVRAGIEATNTEGNRIISINFDPCELNTFANPVTNPVNDIAVLKVVDDNSVTTGQQITYTVTAENKKASSASGIEITDQIPAGLTFVSANPSQGTYDSSTGIWDVGSLNGSQSATLELSVTVNNGTEGNTITNTATLTDITGTDGFENNNEAFIDILVFDPNSGLSCSEPPTFSFLNFSIEQGVQNQVNSVYRYTSVAPGVDAIVTIVNITNATIGTFDDDGTVSGGQATASNFSPLFTTNNGTSNGFIDYEINLVQSGTNIPVRSDFSVTATDIDGADIGGGQTIRDYYGFAQNSSSITQAGNNLETTFLQGDFEIFRSAVTTDAIGTFDIDHIAYIEYKYTSTFRVRAGSTPTGGYPNQRLVEFNFTPCLNQEFTNPVVDTRDADLQITKTVDEANPLENSNVNFVITVQNNGSENATEVFVNETLPTGLTLVESVASQGTFNQLTGLWNIGSLNNGATATLNLEATVGSGITADSLINTAFIDGFNQFDPNNTNDTSKVVLKLAVQLKGTVFEDRKGDGVSEDLNFGDASGDQQALENVIVHLFRDGGDGVANGSDDVFLRSDTTDNKGEYVFNIGESADFWVVINSRTGSLSNGSSWAEQVYAPAGGYCEDGSGNSTFLPTAGFCFGGREADRSDNVPDLPSSPDIALAEHIARVPVNGTSVSAVNFGFSFNVVTNLRDGDDDATATRTIQGSLRQFIQNANSITGANTMRFVPSIPSNSSNGGNNWWNLTLSSALPALTDALTTINGTAFDRSDPLQVINSNPGTLGNAGTSGTDALPLDPFERPELEINGNAESSLFTVSTSGSATIRNVGLYNAVELVRITGGSSILVERSVLGALADGTDPGAQRAVTGVLFSGGSSVQTLIQNNHMRFMGRAVVLSENPSASITVFENEITENALSDATGNGISGEGTWNIQSNLITSNGFSGSNTIQGGSGIKLAGDAGNSSANVVRNNTITSNAVNGISVTGAVSASLIEKNIIQSNGSNFSGSANPAGSGIRLTNPGGSTIQGIRISRNRFGSNFGLAIDLVSANGSDADGVNVNDGVIEAASVTPNAGLDYPVFTLATLESGELRIEGYVGTSANVIPGTYTIEIYKALDDGDSDAAIEAGNPLIRAHGEGTGLIGVITTTSDGRFNTSLPLDGSVPVAFNDRITAIAISNTNNTSEFSANQRIVPTGVTIGGSVYNDANHNTIRDGDENGIQGVTIVLFDRDQNNCRSVLTDSQGNYLFTNILNGTYDLIEAFGQSIPTPDVCTPPAVDPTGFISTTPNLRTVIVNNLPAIQDFGDFEGIRIDGRVFNDNGASGGTANDAILNGGEAGLGSVQVQALVNGTTLVEQTVTDANGLYSLFVPSSQAPLGSQIVIKELNSVQLISTGGSAGNTNGVYTLNDDQTVFTNNAIQEYSDVNFANVPVNQFLTDGQQNALPGAVSLFTHTYTSSTAGTVQFDVASTNNPNPPVWPIVLFNDSNCNLSIDNGEPIIQPGDQIALTAGQNLCLILRVNIPLGLNDGANSATIITATFEYANTNPLITSVLTRSDLVTVSTSEAGLVLIKAVDKQQALPGESLEYTINYENLGDEPISSLEIVDQTPGFTTYQSGSCGTLPTGVTNCTIDAPVVGESGTIKWIFTGTLQPGQSGSVTYIVVIDN